MSAEPNDIAVSAKAQQKISGGYCGVYCLYGAMKLLGADINPNELIKQEYIGSTKGSSLAELKRCAEDHGLYATPVKRLTTKDLRRYQLPVIIHVKSSLARQAYDHYELFLGTRDGKALIYDPPRPIELVALRTLAPRWDGSALIVSDKPIDLGALFASARLRFVIYAAIAIVVVLAVRVGRRRWHGHSGRALTGWKPVPQANLKKVFLLSFGQCAALILTAAACAFAYHSINEEGLLAFQEATASVKEAHQANFIPKLSNGEIRRLLIDGEAVFIDPRPDYNFKTSHLKDAINIPPDATENDRVKTMGRIDKDSRIVVYCRETDYRQAGILASELLSDGFIDVHIYKGNWIQWSTNKKAD
ncbi:MAG: cysteine peptidase family C39 domain-containing protein [Planctomycetota bacterium]